MSKTIRKLLSLLLCMVMVMGMFPAAALAEDPGAPADDADEPVGAGASDDPEETTPPSSQGDDTSPYTGEAEIDPEEPVGADAPGGPSDAPDALPEEPVADDLQAVTASGECGDNLTWTLENNVLTISGTGDMWNWNYDSGAPWNNSSDSVKTVVIQPGVTSIGDYAFKECRSLTNITIADGVTRIGERAFGSPLLTTIDIPSGVTSIGDHAFYYCSSLKSVTIPEGVTSIGDYAFSGCTSLTSVTIPSTVTSVGNNAFYDCSGLTEILVAEGNRSYSSIDGVLYDASGKTLLQCPGGKSGSFAIPAGVTSIGNDAFYKCSRLTSVTIPESVTSIGYYAFRSCENLTSVTIPESVTSIGSGAFQYCSSLTSVTIPESVTSIGDWAFSDCSSLTSVTIPAGVTSIGNGAFYNCSSLTDVYYGGTMAAWKQLGMPYDRAKVSIHCTDGDITADPSRCGEDLIWSLDENGTLTIAGSGDMSDWSYNSHAPWNDNSGSVRTVVIQPGVTSIGDYAFYNCSSLTSVTIPSTVTSIGNYAFYHCTSLTSVTIPEGVTSIGNDTFCRCSGLTEILVAEGNRSYSSIDGVLYDASGKTLLQCPGGKSGSFAIPAGVTSIGNSAFSGCYSLTSVTIPESVTSIGNYAFEYCSGLTSVTIPAGVTSIGYQAFYHCSGLSSVTIPEGVTSIGDYAFSGCNRLTSVTIPEGVTSIGDYAFSGCESLTSVTIPASVTSIGNYAFEYCSSLTDVYYGGTMAAWKQLGMPYDRATVSIHCADGDITADPSRCGDNLIWSLDENGTLTIAGSGDMWDWSYNSDAPWNGNSSSVRTVVIQPGVTSIGDWAFSDCRNLTSVEIPEGVTSIGNWAFLGCSSLTSVTIPGSVTKSFMWGLFEGCGALTDIWFGGTREAWATLGAYPCHYGATVHCSDGEIAPADPIYCGDGLMWTLNSEGVLTVAGTGDMWDYNISYEAPWSSRRSEIKTVRLLSGVTSIGERAFWACYSLTEIRFEGAAPRSDSDCFYGATATAYYPANDPTWTEDVRQNYGENITWVPYVADSAEVASGTCGANGDNLTWILYENGTLLIRGSGAMANWSSSSNVPWYSYRETITDIVLPQGLTSIGNNAFYECSSLTSVTIPSSVTSIGDFAFSGCSSMTGVEIPMGVTSIGVGAFSGCSSLRSVEIPAGVTSIGGYVFADCSSLTSVEIPAGVTTFEYGAFYNCSSLTSMEIPASVTSIGVRAFSGCSGLKTIFFLGDAPTIASNAFTYSSSGSTYQYVRATALYPIDNETWTAGKLQNYGASSLTWLGYRDVAAIYTVHFDPNGGSSAPADQYKGHGVDLTLSTTQPTRADDSAGSYTVSLDPNGGNVSTTSLTAARTSSYTFKDWNEAADGSGASYASGASYTANAAATLYAQWDSTTATAAVTLPTPTRENYSFLGWATSATATEGVTGSYTPTENVTLYAIWQQNQVEPDPDALTLTLGDAEARPGETFTVTLQLTNNPGIKGISAEVIYDENVMTLVSATPKISAGTWSVETIAEDHLIYWYNTDAFTGTDVVELTFTVADSAEEGEYAIGLQFGDWDSVVGPDNNEIESFNIVPGTLTVTHRIPGDINGDGKVGLSDVVLLATYVKARGNGVTIVPGSGDVNGDGKVNAMDVALLATYVKARGNGVVIH